MGRGRDSEWGEGDDMHLLEGESWVAGKGGGGGGMLRDVYDSIIIFYKFAKIMSQEYLSQTKTLNPLPVLWL